MDKQRNKKHMTDSSLEQYFEDYRDDLGVSHLTICAARANFILKCKDMIEPIYNIDSYCVSISLGWKLLKT